MTNKEAILRLKEEIELYTPYAKTWNDARLDIEALEMAIQALEQTQWIPVSEMPKEDGLYLVYTEEQPFVCPFEDGEFFIDDVIAWMPLPKPYEPQEDCDTCKHKDDGWDSEHCDGCCGNHSGFELQERSNKE